MSTDLRVASLAFFLSGAAALVYQVSWQRILALHTGVGVQSVATITAAVMAGLGIGHHWGGLSSARVGALGALRRFALLELLIGVFGLLSCPLFYDLLYREVEWRQTSPAQVAGFHFLAVALPTTLMGMSLPFLARAMVHDLSRAARSIGMLYGINVLGAAVGALLTPWVLIRLWGIRGAVAAAAGLNLAAGFGALLLSRAAAAPPPAEAAAPRRADPEAPGGRPFALWLSLYALSGFCALALEILWFRIIDVGVKGTAFTFGTVLAVYLTGLAAGSLLGGRLTEHLRRPLWAFLVCQSVLLLYAGAALLFFAEVSTDFPVYNDLARYWSRNRVFHPGAEWDLDSLLGLYLLWPAALFGVPTFLMGVSFAVLQRATQDDVRTSGRKVGLLQAANIAGNVAGSLWVGMVALDAVGTTGTMRLLLGVGLVFATLGLAFYGWRSAFPLLAAALSLLVVYSPGQTDLWSRLHGLYDDRSLVEEDATGVASIRPWQADTSELWVTGRRHSWLPYGGMHSALGALPALLHPAPREILAVGLGSGDSAWALGCREETERIDVYEIVAPIERLLRRFDSASKPSKLRDLLRDPRQRLQLADGRNALRRSPARYDIIEIDALHVETTYAGNLHSREFFQLAASRLKPGGLMASWAPTPRVYRTFCDVFPHVVTFDREEILIGSNQPIRVDQELWRGRLLSAHVRGYLGPRISGEVFDALQTWTPASLESRRHIEPNLDLFPRDEFLVPF
jgi:predicted membrane-bound spermidine synthase